MTRAQRSSAGRTVRHAVTGLRTQAAVASIGAWAFVYGVLGVAVMGLLGAPRLVRSRTRFGEEGAGFVEYILIIIVIAIALILTLTVFRKAIVGAFTHASNCLKAQSNATVSGGTTGGC